MFELKEFCPEDKLELSRVTCWLGESQPLVDGFEKVTLGAENYISGARHIMAVFAKSVQIRPLPKVVSRNVYYAIHLLPNKDHPLQRKGPIGYVCVRLNRGHFSQDAEVECRFEKDSLHFANAFNINELRLEARNRAMQLLNKSPRVSIRQPR